MIYVLKTTAVNYNEGVYGVGNYQQTGATSNDPLANTGYDIIVPVALGLSVIIASGVMLIQRLIRRKRTQS